MNANTMPTPKPCGPSCHTPSLPPVLISALLRHHRTLAGLSQREAGIATAMPPSRISGWEAARSPLPPSSARTLLDAYGTPALEIERILALLNRPGHEHRLDERLALPRTLTAALLCGSRTVRFLITDLASLTLLPPSVSPAAAAARGRRPAASGQAQIVLLLNENVLHQACGQPETAHLARIIHLAESGALAVGLIPGQIPAPGALLTEYTYARRGWDGSRTDLLRRQIFVTHQDDGTPNSLSNGPAAFTERQVTEQAVSVAFSPLWSLRRLQEAVALAHHAPRSRGLFPAARHTWRTS